MLLPGLLPAGCVPTPKAARPAAVEASSARSQEPQLQFAPQLPPTQDGTGPEVLLPDPDAKDDEVARIGDFVLRKSHAFTRMLAAEPRLALSAVDLLVFDVLVARHAREHGIVVDPARVAQLVQREEEQLLQQMRRERTDQQALSDYVWRKFGMQLPDWRRSTELRVLQRLYPAYVIRYLALREDRVQVRYIVHDDKKLLEELAQKVREGADFATLALQHSKDALARDGGLLPPFGQGFPHPVAEAALKLQPGELSPVFAQKQDGQERWFLCYCLRRLPRRDVQFAAVRAELEAELEKTPLSQVEISAYTLRWRAALEAATPQRTDDKDRRPR
ncbi:MAG TPA: peptidylprolyl isomerase [Planctomycetota bacterium]|nr:peptidylprolyl isomerase [Planctomycetota bacterium]